MCKRDPYLDALDQASRIAKSTIVISAAPLALLFSQSSVLLQNNSLSLKLVVTVGALSLFAATFIAWGRSALVSLFLAKEMLSSEGDIADKDKGAVYLKFAMRGLNREIEDFDEQFIIEHGKAVSRRFNILAGIGYVAMIAAMLIVIWS